MNRNRNDQEKAMVAAAMLAAHYVAAALKSGASKDEIDSALAMVARVSGITEVWITDEDGRIVYGSHDMRFVFPHDPAEDSQAAPFAALLQGTETVLVQEPGPRQLDGLEFQYVGVAGVDRPRIVQIGMVGGTA